MGKRFLLKIVLGLALLVNAIVFLLSFSFFNMIILVIIAALVITTIIEPTKNKLFAISAYYLFLIVILIYGIYKSYKLSTSETPVITLSGETVTFLSVINVMRILSVVVFIGALLYLIYFIKTEKF